MKTFNLLNVLTSAVLLIGLSPSPVFSQPRPQPLQPEQIRQRQAWHIEMAKIPLPKKGCFQASYPNKQWIEVPCKPARPYPMPPRRGPRPLTVGNGDDVSAQAPTGHISTSIGSFDSSTATSETGTVGLGTTQIAN